MVLLHCLAPMLPRSYRSVLIVNIDYNQLYSIVIFVFDLHRFTVQKSPYFISLESLWILCMSHSDALHPICTKKYDRVAMQSLLAILPEQATRCSSCWVRYSAKTMVASLEFALMRTAAIRGSARSFIDNMTATTEWTQRLLHPSRSSLIWRSRIFLRLLQWMVVVFDGQIVLACFSLDCLCMFVHVLCQSVFCVWFFNVF